MNDTTITKIQGYTVVALHRTVIVKFNDERIMLNTGGWQTRLTINRMNQISKDFNLGYKVYIKNGSVYVDYRNTLYYMAKQIITLNRK